MILAILIIQMTVATDCRAAAEDKPPVIIQVVVEGNQRIEDDAILRVTRAKTGAPYDEALLSEDLEAIYKMGWFDDVRVAVEPSAQGNTVIFTVQEKPTIREIRFSGNVAVDDDTLKENVDISSGSILNIFIVRRNMKIVSLCTRTRITTMSAWPLTWNPWKTIRRISALPSKKAKGAH
ncbi:MAG: POTRA domain-containing protein [Desulfobacterales bacterium]